MANKQHLNLLMQGVDTWNQWRKNNPEIILISPVEYLRKCNLTLIRRFFPTPFTF